MDIKMCIIFPGKLNNCCDICYVFLFILGLPVEQKQMTK